MFLIDAGTEEIVSYTTASGLATSGTFESTNNSLSYVATNIILSADYDLPSGTDLSFELLDDSDNVIETISESEIGSSISISTSSSNYSIRANLSGDGTNTPTVYKYEVGLDDGS